MAEWLKKYPETSVVKEAYEFARIAHKDEKRENGDPYITHCLKVADSVSSWGLDEASVAAALLHDVVEDTEYDLKDIEKKFGPEISFLVNGLTKLNAIQYPKKDPKVESLRKFIISFSRDLRVLIIKLADRLHNMQTVQFLPAERQKKLAWETEEIYAPLAYRLGMQRLSGDLEDLSFPYTHPDEFEWLLKEVKDSYEDRLDYAIKILPITRKAMEENGVKLVSVDARAKRYSSLYKKLIRYNMDLEKIYDLVALRIIVETVEDCYAALGVIHKYWQPLPGQFDDYISRPKPNGYRSLHTTVFCVDSKMTEFQIRTKGMHEEAELGIAAHWAYQQIKSSKKHAAEWRGVAQRKELLWVEQLRNWQKVFSEQKGFIESLKADFFKDRIFVITPENDVIDLPAGATPIDFAYRIHSDIGDSCVGAKVNNKIVTLDYELHSGDMVEIIAQKGKKPSENWLRLAKTSLAQKQIKSALRKREDGGIPKKTAGSPHMEFKIVNRDRSGFLKDVTRIFAELKINITYLNSATEERRMFSNVTVKCDILPEEKLKKLLVRLKAISGTKEVSYKFNRG